MAGSVFFQILTFPREHCARANHLMPPVRAEQGHCVQGGALPSVFVAGSHSAVFRLVAAVSRVPPSSHHVTLFTSSLKIR